MNRVERLVSHLAPSNVKSLQSNNTSASDDDVVVVSAVRTPIGRAKKGSFKDTLPGDLLAAVLKGCTETVGFDKSLVSDIVVGNVLQPGAFATQARLACFVAGYPETTSLMAINRQCSSGLQAFGNVAAAIKAGMYDVGIAAGVESMSTASMGGSVGDLPESVFKSEAAKKCLIPMGQTSELVAEKFGITRQQQDEMAVASHAKALAAQADGRFKEIIPVTTKILDKEGKESTITVTKDDGPRKGTTVEKLSKLRAAFKKNGSTTAGNSSQVSDGAAAVLVMKRSTAKRLNMPILGSFVSFNVSGCPPEIMGIGPAVAIPEACKQAGLSTQDIDVFEINEAFASQATYCCEKLGLDMKKVNPNGGAIALGHPLGCTGARQIGTLFSELKRTGGKYGCVSMCIGTGMGAACIFKNE